MDLTDEDRMKRHAIAYPMEVGAPQFAPIAIREEKDIMRNIARMQAEQEYNRIMDIVAVLKKQADDIQRRLDITDMVHAAEYNFKVVPGRSYWLVKDKRKNITILAFTGPTEWSSGIPVDYEYIAEVRCLGDYSWVEVQKP